MKKEFSASLWREGDWIVAQCLEVDVASQGRGEEEALVNLKEALALHFEPPNASATPKICPLEVEVSATEADTLSTSTTQTACSRRNRDAEVFVPWNGKYDPEQARNMRRSEFKKLAATRLTDARTLLDRRRYAASYYLAGYAVECAVKACIAKQFRANTIPDPKFVNRAYRHNLDELVGVADLRPALDRERRANPNFEANWHVVKDWRPDRRYQTGATRQDATDLYDAITDANHGVFQWLQRHW